MIREMLRMSKLGPSVVLDFVCGGERNYVVLVSM